jgi:hypothetical protein
MRRSVLAIVFGTLAVAGMILAHDPGKGQVKVTQLSQRDILEKLDGKEASTTVQGVTIEPGQMRSNSVVILCPPSTAGTVFV